MKRGNLYSLKPQDIVVLLKILLIEKEQWTQVSLASSLFMSQSEISEAIKRLRYSRLLFAQGKKVNRQALYNFIIYGIPYLYPQHPGEVVRGVPTSHSASPLKDHIVSNEHYVWYFVKGDHKGHSIQPLYPSVVNAVQLDADLHKILALIDALRVGKVREQEIAEKLLKHLILD